MTESANAPQTELTSESLEERITSYEEWLRGVRDPASAASEGIRRLASANGKAIAEYEIAPLPGGRWVIRTRCEYSCGDFSGRSSPWNDFDTREQCIDDFLNAARRHFEPECTGSLVSESQVVARSQILSQLKDTGLFGFMEPDVVRADQD